MAERWVLVTADGPQLRDPLVAVRALAAGGYRAAVAVSCGSSVATASRDCARVVHVPSPHGPGYAEAIQAEMRRTPYVTVLPASEAGLLGLGGAPEHLVDKALLEKAAEAVGIASPPTRAYPDADALLAEADAFSYPVIAKPSVHTANAVRADRPADLRVIAGMGGEWLLQPFLTDDLTSLCGVVHRGRLVAAVHERWYRIWPADCGVASSAISVAPDRDLEARMLALLDGYDGLFNAQFVGPYLLDLNMRLSTTLPLAVAAGANLVAIWCDLLRGEEVSEVRARPGVRFRWFEGDMRSIVAGVRRERITLGEAVRSALPMRGAAHATESIRDPKPLLARASYLAKRALGAPR